MLEPDEIASVDRSSICSAYDNWPIYCRQAASRRIDADAKLFDGVSSIVFSGMGGSGTTGDIIADLMRLGCSVPIHVLKGYHVPAFVDSGTLFITMSVSGGTEETLTSMVEAIDAGARIAAVSRGGEMEQICRRKNLLHIKIEQRILPRVTLPDVLYSVLNLLAHSPFLDGLHDQIQDSVQTMEQLGQALSVKQRYDDNPAKQLAHWMLNSLPIAYCSPLERGVGIRFKNSMNENAKMHAFAADILDSCHNEIVPWSSTKDDLARAIMVRNRSDPKEVSTRFDVFREMLENNGHQIYEVPLYGSTPLSGIVASLYLLDYATVYLGILQKIDPTPIDAVFELKRRIGERLNYFARFVRPLLD